MKYEEIKLSELVDTISDTGKIDKDKVILVNTSDVLAGDVLNHTYTDNCNLRGQFKKRFKQNDILYSEIRPANKRFAYVDFDSEDYIASTKLMVLRRKSDKITNRYLYYCLTSDSFIERMQHLAESRSGTFPQITFDVLKAESIYLPSVDNQNKITNILDSINNKVKINNEINNNLSEQLKVVYNKYFEKISFDNIPEGWRFEKVKNIAILSQGVQVPIEKQIETKEENYVRFIRIVDITQHNEKDVRYIKNTDRGNVKENEIFMTRYGTPGIISRNYKGIIANNLFKIIPITEEITSNYLYSFFNSKTIQNYIKGNATSSTMPAINFSTLNDRDIIIPKKEILNEFDKFSETIRLKQLNIINENNTLVKLRDILLPKLMSGEIDLENIEI